MMAQAWQEAATGMAAQDGDPRVAVLIPGKQASPTTKKGKMMITISHTSKVILAAALMSAMLGACRKAPTEQTGADPSGATSTAPAAITNGSGTSGTSGTGGTTGTSPGTSATPDSYTAPGTTTPATPTTPTPGATPDATIPDHTPITPTPTPTPPPTPGSNTAPGTGSTPTPP